ncbi:MAG: hypothetical protein P4L00_07770 [Candidatus Acidoferrales bacterium]|nr:hypothetical protein [Candidatus Acidoferrales bacterium]
MSCAICEKRPPTRYCPAKGVKICAICCGREREVTIDCPADCPHLIAAHRYEAEHRKPPSAAVETILNSLALFEKQKIPSAPSPQRSVAS